MDAFGRIRKREKEKEKEGGRKRKRLVALVSYEIYS
jgi:hypothetical protein